MFDISTASAADLRARVAALEAEKMRAERKRVELAGARGEALLALTVDEVLEFDADLARTAIEVERANAHLGKLRPALAAAEAREAAEDDRKRDEAERSAFAETRRSALALHGSDLAAARPIAQAMLAANAPAPRDANPALFDEPRAPTVTYGDNEAWWRAREERLRAEGRPSDAMRR